VPPFSGRLSEIRPPHFVSLYHFSAWPEAGACEKPAKIVTRRQIPALFTEYSNQFRAGLWYNGNTINRNGRFLRSLADDRMICL